MKRPTKRRGEDRGSMPMAMLVVLVGVSLSAMLTNIVLSRMSDTSHNERKSLALHAAQAGLDVGLAQLRGAVTANPEGELKGDRAKLPCTGLPPAENRQPGNGLEGKVGGGNDASYEVWVRYYRTDPQGQSATWLDNNAVACQGNNGPQYVPAFAMFTSTGTGITKGKTAKRTLDGTYILHTANTNIYGGLLRSAGAYASLCVDAGSNDPLPGQVVTMQKCSSGSVRQTWAYNDVLQFVLVVSQTPSRPRGLCLEAGTTHVDGKVFTLEPCQATAPSLWRQQWSFNDNSNLLSTNLTNGANTGSFCMAHQGQGMPLLLTNKTCSTGTDNTRRWAPDSALGAGMAASDQGRKVGQLVNYYQFGRCLDATNQDPGYTHMIAWPCKQNPSPANVSWNQKYTLPALDVKNDGLAKNFADGTIYTYKNTSPTGTYCLTSPMSPNVSQYVKTRACTGNANQNWTVYGKTDQYATAYQIVDGTGNYCLTPRDVKYSNPADLFKTENNVSKIYVAPCDGSTLQKWNADKNVIEALALKDIKED
ncbi:ricin-type beta-trefoil lectin domain protein [Actinoplanes sp. GCM10030250]|uniref:RICIN domain-containing protein n=1 Tax=Actinoplanes sp. GCM10030250 TaxID=3273376 RepID=UPI003606DC1B